MIEKLKNRFRFLKMFLKFNRYLDAMLYEEMKGLEDGEYTISYAISKESNTLNLTAVETTDTAGNEINIKPFCLSMYMINRLSGDYLTTVRRSALNRALGFRTAFLEKNIDDKGE